MSWGAVLPPSSAHAEEPSAPQKRSAGMVGYDKGLYVATADDLHRIGIEGRLVTRWTVGRFDGLIQNRFNIPTARLGLNGHLFAVNTFELSGELSGGQFELRDAFVDRPFLGARLRLGQFKVPAMRQQMTSLSQMQFMERASTHGFVGLGRDVGVSLYQRPKSTESGAEWYLGVFNGRGGLPFGASQGAVPQVAARVGWSSAHLHGYDEADFDGGPLRVASSLSYVGDVGNWDALVHRFNVDGMVKAYGTSLSWAMALTSRPSALHTRTLKLAGHAQIGHFLVPRRVEVAARYVQVPEGSLQRHEVFGVLNLYRFEHRLKWQVEGGTAHLSGGALDWLARIQMQALL